MDQTDTRNPALVAFAGRLNISWKTAGHASRAAAAIAAATTGGYFARLCAGNVEPGITIIARLAQAFSVEPGWLAFGESAKPAREPRARKGKS